MDDREYRRLCAQPDVMRRSELRATITRLAPVRPDLAGRLSALLPAPPVPKPPGHAGGPDADHRSLDLTDVDIEEIVEALGDLEAWLVEADAPAGPLGAAGSLLDRWNGAESSRPAV